MENTDIVEDVGQVQLEEQNDTAHTEVIEAIEPEEKLVARNLREKIHFTLSLGKYSRLSLVYQIFQTLVIWASVINFLVSSLPQYWELDLVPLEAIEKTSVSIFTIDYLARLVTAEPGKRLQWIIKPLHIFDLLVIIPFYIEIILTHGNFNPSGDSLLVITRALRLFQMFRSIKIAQYSSLIPLFIQALIKSKEGFTLFTFSVTIVMVVVSAVMFYAEQTMMEFDLIRRTWFYPNGEIAAYQSIPATFWWFVATITTVGYGDIFPHSDLGKFIASATMVGGLFVLAVPVAVFCSNFSTVWDEKMEENKSKQNNTHLIQTKDMSREELAHLLETNVRKFTTKVYNLKESLDKLVEEEKEIYSLMRELNKKINANQKIVGEEIR